MTSNRQYSIPLILITGLLAIVALSCKGDSSITGPGLPFSLTAHVTHPGGAPAAGVQIAFWNDLRYTPITASKRAPGIERTAATSSIRFGVPVRSHVRLSVLDLFGNPFGPPTVDEVLEAGVYSANWNTSTRLPIAVLKCVLEGLDTSSGDVLERAEISMLVYQPDNLWTLNGYSDASGTFRTSNSLEFPNLLTLPRLLHTADDPTPLDVITVLDSVTVVLNDTSAGLHQTYRRKIQPGANELSFVLSPTAALPASAARSVLRDEPARLVRLDVGPISSHFELNQNYPNPFN